MNVLSIIIVNYKSWEPLSKCLDSIQNQKNINLEVIVLDNNSNDNKTEFIIPETVSGLLIFSDWKAFSIAT